MTLSGTLAIEHVDGGPGAAPVQPVTLLTRREGSRRWRVLARVQPVGADLVNTTYTFTWSFTLRPRRTALYLSRDWLQPPRGTVWARATSRVVRVVVR